MFLQRKYTDLIYQASSRWVNWDPPIPIQVGAYGAVDRDTGEFNVQGNIYNDEFQQELNRLNIQIAMNSTQHQPKDGGPEDEYIITSSGATRVAVGLGPQVGVPGLANATFSGQWQFENGKRDALLIMFCPRQRYIPTEDGILDQLYDVPILRHKWIVTSTFVCPAFSMYLSNKSGERLSLALTGQVPLPVAPGINVGAQGDLSWWSDMHADMLRKACDRSGNYCFTPLYTLKKRRNLGERIMSGLRLRIFRDGPQSELSSEPAGDSLWEDSRPEWEPLDDDGEEDPITMKEDENNEDEEA